MARKKYLKVGMEGVVVHGRVSTVREGPDSMAVRGPAIPSGAPGKYIPPRLPAISKININI